MKSSENMDYWLFGIDKLSEEKYFEIIHSTKNTLKVANHELAFWEIKFIEEFYEFFQTSTKWMAL